MVPGDVTSLLPQRLCRLNGETAERGTDRGKHTHGGHHRDDSGQEYQRPAAHHPTPRHCVQCCGDDQSKDDASAQLCARPAEDSGEHTAGVSPERGADADLPAPDVTVNDIIE